MAFVTRVAMQDYEAPEIMLQSLPAASTPEVNSWLDSGLNAELSPDYNKWSIPIVDMSKSRVTVYSQLECSCDFRINEYYHRVAPFQRVSLIRYFHPSGFFGKEVYAPFVRLPYVYRFAGSIINHHLVTGLKPTSVTCCSSNVDI